MGEFVCPSNGVPELGQKSVTVALKCRGLGGVDSKDSLLGANQIQGFFFGGSLGCDGSFGVERCRMGANGAADHRAA